MDQVRFPDSRGEAFAAGAVGDGVGVGDFKAAFLKVVTEINFGAADKEGGFGVNDDPDAAGFDKDVAVGGAVDEVHFVLEAGATAAKDGDAEGAVGALLAGEEAGEAGGGLFGEFDEALIADFYLEF